AQAEADWPAPLSELGRNPYPEKEEKLADQIEPTSTTGALRSVVTPRWHLIVHENLGDQLYDWTKDPQESRNLAGASEAQGLATDLTALFPGALVNLKMKQDAGQISSAKAMQDGTFDLELDAQNEYFKVMAAPGAKIAVELHARQLNPKSRMDPVLAL